MKVLGLDIGTTSISAVAYDTQDGVLVSQTLKNDGFLPGQPWERLQDPDRILKTAREAVRDLLAACPDAEALGVTGQMHGILYLNRNGDPVGPLYTWQDGRGNLPYDENHSWAEHLSACSGMALATGYGMVTHGYNLERGCVPEGAACLCTIGDYVAMKLAGCGAPRMDATNAASLGFFQTERGVFDGSSLQRAGIDPGILPDVGGAPCLGTGELGIPVYRAIGDNQAAFMGAAGGHREGILVNVGTGSQVCVYSPGYLEAEGLETRPFPMGGWLLVGASLCGGRSYALLERFFRQTVSMVTGLNVCAYDAMSRALEEAGSLEDAPEGVTTFQGTRRNPSLRGSITGISTDNFTPAHITYSILRGMARELYEMVEDYLEKTGTRPSILVGSGNGLRKNPQLCRIMEGVFGCPLILSQNQEEAACGAAMYAAENLGKEE